MKEFTKMVAPNAARKKYSFVSVSRMTASSTIGSSANIFWKKPKMMD